MIRVLSLGAGVQSTTVLLMSALGELPKLDAAVFADTRWEPEAVYTHLDWLEKESGKYGIPVHRVTAGDLRKESIEFRATGGKGSGLTNKRYASMPLFVKNPDGTTGLIRRQCTGDYKIQPVEKFIRRELLKLKPRQRAKPDSVEHWFGISYDEAVWRVRVSPNKWQTFHYPLVTDVKSRKTDSFEPHGFNRQECLDWLKKNGFPEPPRSACVGCPFHSDDEWFEMKKNRPREWADAVAFDKAIRAADAALINRKFKGKLIGTVYLHSSCVPLDEVVWKARFRLKMVGQGFRNECMGVCEA